MHGPRSSRTIPSVLHTIVNLGLLAWGLFLITYGWPLLHTGNGHDRMGGFTFVGGGLLLIAAAAVGIVLASSKLRRRR